MRLSPHPAFFVVSSMQENNTYTVAGLNMSLLSVEERQQIFKVLNKHKVRLTQITSSQRLVIHGLSPAACQALQQDISSIVPVRNGVTVTYVQSCPGKEQCKYGISSALSIGRKLEQLSFPKPLPHKVKVSVAGCRICCTEPYVRDVGLIAEQKGWKVVVVFGGNAGGRPRIADTIAVGLAEDAAVELVERCLLFYLQHGHKKQRTARFIEQYGIDTFKKKIM